VRPPGGASSLFGGASLLFRGVASGDRGGAGGAWSSSPLESNLWPSINGSERLGASSLDGRSLGVTINEDASRGGDDAGPLGTSEPTQQDHHHHHVHEAEQRAARKFHRLLQACWPQLPPSLEAPHGSNMVVGGKIQENKIHDQQKWLSAAIQARLTTSRQSPS